MKTKERKEKLQKKEKDGIIELKLKKLFVIYEKYWKFSGGFYVFGREKGEDSLNCKPKKNGQSFRVKYNTESIRGYGAKGPG